ncbi:ribonuclease H-like domain-containing protein [Tanacetum coccineum]|uniref:Ribonuclease H-like domain-containing protein n=1 Tax=Tanacetum coccineum TaxID=301880 RepID=A0ABQ5A9H1_9ASTR
MDTGSSSHLNSSVNNLSTIFNSRIYPSVLVGDGKSIHVTNTGHNTLPTPYRTLHINNVLITPNIVKNLISIGQHGRPLSSPRLRYPQAFLILVPRPPDANIVRSMCLFRHKYNADGTLSRYKARLVANSSTQLQGADTAYLLLYVDDIVLTASSSDLLQQIITSLHAEFSMTDLGFT